MSFTRFAIYYLPSDGALATFGASWLGWDVARGTAVSQLNLEGLEDVTATPRKYGFHGTLKAPFRLADGLNLDSLQKDVASLAGRLSPADCQGLQLTALGNFLALVPQGDAKALAQIASACVRELDRFRAPAGSQELTRRRTAGLTPEQDALLLRWGYPYVMEEFRFHMTLTGKLAPDLIKTWKSRAAENLPDLPSPFVVNEIALAGERDAGGFELIHRYALTG